MTDGSVERDQVYFRGFKGRYDAGSGRTLWDESTAAFAYDLALNDPDDSLATLPPWQVGLVQAAIDLHRACVRTTWNHSRSSGFAVLPPTLLAIPSGFKLEPEPTPFVRIRAALDHTSLDASKSQELN